MRGQISRILLLAILVVYVHLHHELDQEQTNSAAVGEKKNEVLRTASSAHVLPHGLAGNISRSRVCLYGSMPFFLSENTTKTFAMNLLVFLRDVSLRSFNDGILTLSSDKVKVLIPISTYKPHFESFQALMDFLQPVVSTYTNLEVDFAPTAYTAAKEHFRSGDISCEWVISIKLDADDVMAPGYIDWLVQHVVPSLEQERRSSNTTTTRTLYGALVASRLLPKVIFGYGRCRNQPFGRTYWPGYAVGQAKVVRSHVFRAIGLPFEGSGHTGALTFLRRLVSRKMGVHRVPQNLFRVTSDPTNITLQRQHDAELERRTGIRMIDSVEAGFGFAGIYLMTPLSGHFGFEYLLRGNSPTCTIRQWRKVAHDAMKRNHLVQPADDMYDYVHNVTMARTNLTLLDLCRSHEFFKRGNFGKTLKGDNCEEMEVKYQEQLTRLPP